MIYKRTSFLEIMGEEYMAKVKEHIDKSIKDGAFLMKSHLEAQPITLKETKHYLNKMLSDIELISWHLNILKLITEFDTKDA